MEVYTRVLVSILVKTLEFSTEMFMVLPPKVIKKMEAALEYWNSVKQIDYEELKRIASFAGDIIFEQSDTETWIF